MQRPTRSNALGDFLSNPSSQPPTKEVCVHKWQSRNSSFKKFFRTVPMQKPRTLGPQPMQDTLQSQKFPLHLTRSSHLSHLSQLATDFKFVEVETRKSLKCKFESPSECLCSSLWLCQSQAKRKLLSQQRCLQGCRAGLEAPKRMRF